MSPKTKAENDNIIANLSENSPLPTPIEFIREQNSDQILQFWVEKHTNDKTTPFQPKLVPSCDVKGQMIWADAASVW